MSNPDATRTSNRQFTITTIVALLGVAATIFAAFVGGAADNGGPKDVDPGPTPPARTGEPAPPSEPSPATRLEPEPVPIPTKDRTVRSPAVEPPPDDTSGNSSANDELVGEWVGSGNQYPNDGYRMQIDLTLAPDGGFQIIRGGATREQGIYAVQGTDIVFQSDLGSTYSWGWTMAMFGNRPVLKVQNQYGGVFMLQKQ